MTKYDCTDEMIRKQALHTIFEEIEYGKEDKHDRNSDDILDCFLFCRRNAGYVLPKI